MYMKDLQKYKIFCFPFAGGSRYSFNLYKRNLPENIELISLDYPGRGMRVQEPLIKNIYTLVDHMYEEIKGQLDGPYMIYGHSMGALIAFLVTHKILENQREMPERLFITGCRSPLTWYKGKRLFDLPYEEFVEELKLMGGVPTQLLADKDSMGFFEPILRADFEVVSSFKYKQKIPLEIPLSVIIGTDEEVSDEDALAWQRETRQPLEFQRLSGDHFFIFEQAQAVMKEMMKHMSKQKHVH